MEIKKHLRLILSIFVLLSGFTLEALAWWVFNWGFFVGFIIWLFCFIIGYLIAIDKAIDDIKWK